MKIFLKATKNLLIKKIDQSKAIFVEVKYHIKRHVTYHNKITKRASKKQRKKIDEIFKNFNFEEADGIIIKNRQNIKKMI